MVTPAYIRGLDVADLLLWQPVDAETVEARIVAHLDSQLADWSPDADSLLRRAVTLISYQLQVLDEERQQEARRGLLELLGLEVGPDGRLTPIAYRPPLIGSLAWIEEQARVALPAITDALAVAAPNRQDVALFALVGERVELTRAQQEPLLRALNGRGAVIAGVEITLPGPTEVPYTIELEATYDAARTDGGDLEARIRAAVYGWLADHQRIGQSVYRSALAQVSYVDGVLDLAVHQPLRDLAPPTLDIISAADDPGAGAAGYPVIHPTSSSGVGLLEAITLTRAGSGYAVAPTVRIHDDVGRRLDLVGVLTGDRLTGVQIPHPQSLTWYAYPTSTWAPVYVCASDATDVRISVIPVITPLSGRVSLADSPPEVEILANAVAILEGQAARFAVRLSGAQRADVEVQVAITSSGPPYGVLARTATVLVPQGRDGLIDVPSVRQSYWQPPGEIAVRAVESTLYDQPDGGASATTEIRTRGSLLSAVATGAREDGTWRPQDEISLGDEAVWTISLATLTAQGGGYTADVTAYYTIEQSPDGVIEDSDDLGTHSVTIRIRPGRDVFGRAIGPPRLRLYSAGYAVIRIPTLAQGSGGVTGTLTLLLESVGVTPLRATGRYVISANPMSVTAQAT